MVKTLLTTHFYNEEFLLPFWIKHHLPLFDEAVLLNWNSTDRSVEIIKELAPHWQIKRAKMQVFGGDEHKEIEEIEKGFQGYWKICLNIPEFIFHYNIKEFIRTFREQHPDKKGFCLNAAILVEPPNTQITIDFDKPLVLQNTFGYFQNRTMRWSELKLENIGKETRTRLIHCAPFGNYHPGRHRNKVSRYISSLILLWFGLWPWEFVKYRKIQMYHRIRSKSHRQQRKQEGGLSDRVEDLDAIYDIYQKISYDLMTTHEDYKTMFESIRKIHNV